MHQTRAHNLVAHARICVREFVRAAVNEYTLTADSEVDVTADSYLAISSQDTRKVGKDRLVHRPPRW